MKCKQGDLAFIKKALRIENIGKIVTCEKYLGYYERGADLQISGENWSAFDSGDHWLISGNLETQFGKASQGYILDAWLTPIEPLDPEYEDTQEESDEGLLETI